MTDNHAPAQDDVAQPVPEHDVISSIPGSEQSDQQVPADAEQGQSGEAGPEQLILQLDKKVVRALRDTFLAVADGKQGVIIARD